MPCTALYSSAYHTHTYTLARSHVITHCPAEGLYDDSVLDDSDRREGPFDAAAAINGQDVGYTVGGTAWYRKTFPSPEGTVKGATPSRKKAFIRFDGVYMNADVYLNGHFLGNHPYGYTGFEYDVTPYLVGNGGSSGGGAASSAAPAHNVLAVRVNNFGSNSRWYSGSGIYRHVWLTIVDSVYIPLWGVSIATPHVQLSSTVAAGSGGDGDGSHPSRNQRQHQRQQLRRSQFATAATVVVQVNIVNSGATATVATASVGIKRNNATTVRASREGLPATSLLAQGCSSPVHLEPHSNATVSLSIDMPGLVHLWSPESPTLYTATVTVTTGGERIPAAVAAAPQPQPPPRASQQSVSTSDTVEIKFGVRTLQFDSETGFRLNGVHTKLYGGCVHHDNGPLGAAAIDRAEERKIQLLKAQGYVSQTHHITPFKAVLILATRQTVALVV